MKRIVPIFLLSLLSLTSVYAKNSGVTLTSSSFQEKVVMDKNGEESLRLVPAAKVVPGDVVIYKNDILNRTQKGATDLVITNSIPEHMEYVEGSSVCQTQQGCTMQFSVDEGKTFKSRQELVIQDFNGESRLAEAKEITTIQWIVKQISSGERYQVTFKARLK